MLNGIKHFVSKKPKEETQLESYQNLLQKAPENVNVRLKLGDLYAKLGKKAEAIKEYTAAAIQYGNDGYLIKAIAVNKIIVRLDPSHQEALDRLSDLYFQRGIVADPLVQNYRQAKQQAEKTAATEAAPAAGDQELDFTVEPEPSIDLTAGSQTEPDLEAALQAVPLLASIGADTHRWLARHVLLHQFGEGHVILQPDTSQDSLFILLDGNVRLLTKDREGQDTLLDRIGGGDFFGELTIFAPVRQNQNEVSKSAMTAIVESDCTILELPKAILTTLVKREPEVSEKLFMEYSKRRASDVALARVPLFSYLDPSERRKIADHLTPVNVRKGSTIITEGEIGDSMYLIKSGEVGIYTTLVESEGVSVIKTDQERLHLATLREGDFFGEQALITKEPRSATIIALTDVQLLKFSKHDLAQVVKQYPRVGTLLKKYHQQRISNTLESLKSIW